MISLIEVRGIRKNIYIIFRASPDKYILWEIQKCNFIRSLFLLDQNHNLSLCLFASVHDYNNVIIWKNIVSTYGPIHECLVYSKFRITNWS